MKPKSPQQQSLTLETLIIMCGKASAMLFTILIPIVLVRTFNKADFGLYKQFFLVHYFASVFIQMAMRNGLYYFYFRARDRLEALMTNTLIVLTISSLFFAFIMLAGGDLISRALNNPGFADIMLILVLYAICMTFGELWEDVLIIEKNSPKAALRVSIFAIVDAAITISIAYAYRSMRMVLLGLTLFAVVKLFIFLTYLYRHYKPHPRKFDHSLLHQQIIYTMPLYGSSILAYLQKRLDKLLVSFIFDPMIFAVYAVGTIQIPVIKIFRQSATSLLARVFSEQHSEEKFAKVVTTWNNSIRKLSIVMIGAMFFLAAFSTPIVNLVFTRQYSEAALILAIFATQLPLDALTGIDAILRAFNETTFMLKANIYFVLLGLVLMLGFVWADLGVLGIALGYTLSSYMAHAYKVNRARKLLNVRWSKLLPWYDLLLLVLCGLIGVSAALLPYHLMAPYPILALGLAAACYAVIYLTLLTVMNIVRPNERSVFKDMIRRRLERFR